MIPDADPTGDLAEIATDAARSPRQLFRAAMKRIPAVFAGIVLITFVVFAFTPVSWLPHDPRGGDLFSRFIPPAFMEGGSSEHLLGTDVLGRDILSMLIAGTRYTLMIVFAAALIGMVIGVSAGLIAGYYQGWVSSLIMRLADIQLAFPVLVLLIAVVAAFGSSIPTLILILGVTAWAPYARIVRASVLSLKEKEFVEAARSIGLSNSKIILRHLLPNSATTIIIFATFELAQLVLIEASLSFLGLGIQPPTPSWGKMISESREYLYTGWWASALPGIFIVLAVLAFNLLGDNLRDILDPRSGDND